MAGPTQSRAVGGPASISDAGGGDDLLAVRGVSKAFPGVQALTGVDFTVRRGEVHALLGENGAGKSTLLKILAGAQRHDEGTIRFDGREVAFASPIASQQAGIVTIYQEFNLVPNLSIAENVYIGREPKRGPFVDWAGMKRMTVEQTARVGLAVDPMRLVRDLSVAEQQMVEIAKALSMDAKLVIMDEPTSALSEAEVEKLFQIVRDLKAHGIAVIFVTHRLDEVLRTCDRITVLRDGRLVGSAHVADVSVEAIIRMMVGREIEQLDRHRPEQVERTPVLEVRNAERLGDAADPHAVRVHDVSFKVHAGEIVGIAGLVGAGRTELARAIFGADHLDGGEVLVEGRPVAIRSPKDAIAHGIGLVPEDRKQQALFLSLAIRPNLSITALDKLKRFAGWTGFVDESAESRLIEQFRQKLSIKMAGPEQQVVNLSGGNQQKVVLARWLALGPKVLIVDEPTRGIDVAAKNEVHHLLFELAEQGIAIVVISSELPEVLRLADRILTMSGGRLTGEVLRNDATEERLMALMTTRSSIAA